MEKVCCSRGFFFFFLESLAHLVHSIGRHVSYLSEHKVGCSSHESPLEDNWKDSSLLLDPAVWTQPPKYEHSWVPSSSNKMFVFEKDCSFRQQGKTNQFSRAKINMRLIRIYLCWKNGNYTVCTGTWNITYLSALPSKLKAPDAAMCIGFVKGSYWVEW